MSDSVSVQPDPPNPHPEFPTGPPRGAKVVMTSTAAQIEDVRGLIVENKVLAAALQEDDHRAIRGVVKVTVVLEQLPAFH